MTTPSKDADESGHPLPCAPLRDGLVSQAKDQEAALKVSGQFVLEMQSKMRAMLAKIDGGKAAERDARGVKGGRFDTGVKEDNAQLLSEAVSLCAGNDNCANHHF